MHRIDTPTAQKDKFGQGKNGFTRGNPQTGTLATKMDSLYFDAIQEEIANAIESVGIPLNKEKHDQLKLAIQQYVKNGQIKLSSATNSESETEAATPLAVKKVNDNANNAHNRISEVDNRAAIANANAISANSNANNAHNRINDIHDKFEPCANESRIYSHDKRFYVIVRDDGVVGHLNVGQKKITWAFDGNGNLFEGFVPANRVTGFYESVANTFNQSFGGNGYTKLPTGMIIQWGTAKSLGSTGANGTLQPFFITFPNACLLVTTNDIGNGVNSTSAAVFSNSQFRCWGKTPYGGAAYTDTAMNYIAIGF